MTDTTEVWLPCRVYFKAQKTLICYDQYEASNLGQVRNKHRESLLKPHLLCGYKNVCLYRDKQRKTISIHKIILSTFSGAPPDETHSVDHIDRNPLNNHVGNLRWSSISEQMSNRKRSKSHGLEIPIKRINQHTSEETIFTSISTVPNISNTTLEDALRNKRSKGDYCYEVIPISFIEGEAWKKWNSYEISNHGRLRKLQPWTNTYYEVTLKPNVDGYVYSVDRGRRYNISRLVAHLLMGLDLNDTKMFVNHLSEVTGNNHVDNLELTTQLENTRHSCLKCYQVTNTTTNTSCILVGLDQVLAHTQLNHSRVYYLLKNDSTFLGWKISCVGRRVDVNKQIFEVNVPQTDAQ